MRATPINLATTEAQQFTQILRDTTSLIIGRPLNDEQWAQASLPVRLGGLGLRDTAQTRPVARWAAVLDFAERQDTVLGLPPSVGEWTGDFIEAGEAVKLATGGAQPITAIIAEPARVTELIEKQHFTQKWWGDQAAKVAQQKLENQLQGVDAVRYSCQKRPHTLEWTTVTPCAARKTLLPTKEFQALMQWTLGCNVFV
jgi:hypothetical protein